MALSAVGTWKQIPVSCAFISAKELGYCFYLKLVAMVVSSGLVPWWKLFVSVTQQRWQPSVCIHLQQSSNCRTGTSPVHPKQVPKTPRDPWLSPEGVWEPCRCFECLQLLRLQRPQTEWECWRENPQPERSFPRCDPDVLFGFCSTTWNFWEVSRLTFLKGLGSPAWHSDVLIQESLPFSNEPQSLCHRQPVIPLIGRMAATRTLRNAYEQYKLKKEFFICIYFRWQFSSGPDSRVLQNFTLFLTWCTFTETNPRQSEIWKRLLGLKLSL